MKNSTQHLLRSKGGGGVLRRPFFPLFLRVRGPSKKHACFLEGAVWDFSWLDPPGPCPIKQFCEPHEPATELRSRNPKVHLKIRKMPVFRVCPRDKPSGKFQRLPEACARLLAKFGEGKALFWRTPLVFLQTSVCLLNIQCVQRPLPASDCRSRPPSPTQR